MQQETRQHTRYQNRKTTVAIRSLRDGTEIDGGAKNRRIVAAVTRLKSASKAERLGCVLLLTPNLLYKNKVSCDETLQGIRHDISHRQFDTED